MGRWESRDVHRRAASTLNTARAEQMALSLGLTNGVGQATAAQSPRCTACHAPGATVPTARSLGILDAAEGVACETCHAPAETWIRSHTRPGPPRDDFSYTDKVADGLRDLRDLRVRANVCVACHENLERAVLEAGHPELIFELDGQTRQEPRHWVEKTGYHGAKAWLVGQAVAWREVAWLRAQPAEATERAAVREGALSWLVLKAAKALGVAESAPEELARRASSRSWSNADTEAVLRALGSSAADFRAKEVPAPVHARRAERLVLGLDRLVAALPESRAKALEPGLDELFKRAQSLPDFAPERFADALADFAAKL